MEKKSIIPISSKRNSDVSSEDKESATDSEFQAEISRVKIVKTFDGALPQDGEEISLEESLFSNDLLLREIFKHLNFNDLQSCRPVQRLWNLEATKLLLKNFPMMSIKVSSKKVTFDICDSKMELTEFQKFVEMSHIFPCNSFATSHCHLNKTAKDLFSTVGHLVKSLSFKNNSYSYRSDPSETSAGMDMIMFLAENLPNLETLVLNCTLQISETEAKSLFDVVQMKKLQVLELTNPQKLSPSLVSAIMKIAPSLTKIYSRVKKRYSLALTQFIEIKAIPLLKNIRLNFSSKMYTIFEQVLDQDPKFVRIDQILFREDDDSYPSDLRRIGRILTKMFHQCSKSLKEIDMLLPLGHFPGLKIPVLPNVTSLGIYYFESDHEIPKVVVPVFPPEVNFQHTFPILQKLELCFGLFEELASKGVFPESSTPLLSVRSLKIFSAGIDHLQIPEIWMKQFSTLFPCTTNANFCEMSLPTLELVWGFQSLETLKLIISTANGLNLFPALDSAFTGFSHKTMRRFYKKSPASLELFEESDVKSLRVKPSVVDLIKLKSMCIEFVYDGMDSDDTDVENTVTDFAPVGSGPVIIVKDKIILSHLTKRFGFEMCPQLGSNIAIMHSEVI